MYMEKMTVNNFLLNYKGRWMSIIEEKKAHGGKAFLQWYEAPLSEMDNEHEEKEPPTKQKKREPSEKPLVLAICTPLMARTHRNVIQAGEIVFCDSSSSMDRFNTSVFILSTTTAYLLVMVQYKILHFMRQFTSSPLTISMV